MFKLQDDRLQPVKIQVLCMLLLLASQIYWLREGLSTSPVEMPLLFRPFTQLPNLTCPPSAAPMSPALKPPSPPTPSNPLRRVLRGEGGVVESTGALEAAVDGQHQRNPQAALSCSSTELASNTAGLSLPPS